MLALPDGWDLPHRTIQLVPEQLNSHVVESLPAWQLNTSPKLLGLQVKVKLCHPVCSHSYCFLFFSLLFLQFSHHGAWAACKRPRVHYWVNSLTGCSDPVSLVKIALLGYLAEAASALTSPRTGRWLEAPPSEPFLSALHLTVLQVDRCVYVLHLFSWIASYFSRWSFHTLLNLLRQQEVQPAWDAGMLMCPPWIQIHPLKMKRNSGFSEIFQAHAAKLMTKPTKWVIVSLTLI